MSTFKCEGCQQTFDKIRPDTEAMQEYEEIWGKDLGEEKGILCDDCNKLFMEWLKTCNVQN